MHRCLPQLCVVITYFSLIQSMSTETSLIATSTAVEDYSDAQMIDIPFDLDIEVNLITT